MATKTPRVWSDLAIPPGDTLAEELEARGMTQKELAARLGRPAQVINEIIRARKAITPDTALGLEKALEISAQFWINLETNYQMTLARNREQKKLAASVDCLQHYPVNEMIRRGWIKAGRDKISKLAALQGFLGTAVAEPTAVQKVVGFRITEAAQQQISLGALAVWLRKGELEAQEISTAPYDAERFRRNLENIRKLTERSFEEVRSAVTSLCADAGVVFCMIPEFPKIGANGAMRWLADNRPLIQMSLRYKWADIFWFTFFHEAGHVLLHPRRRRIVIDGLEPAPDMAGSEAEADAFARDLLIPPEPWDQFCHSGCFTQDAVQEFARTIEIAPGIVVGRLQKEKRIGHSQLADLKPLRKCGAVPIGA